MKKNEIKIIGISKIKFTTTYDPLNEKISFFGWYKLSSGWLLFHEVTLPVDGLTEELILDTLYNLYGIIKRKFE
jgi:hypothetical protein